MPGLALLWLGWLFLLALIVNSVSAERKRALIASRLSQIAEAGEVESAEARARRERRPYRLYAALIAPLLARLGQLMSWSTPSSRTLERQLLEAGHPWNMQPLELLGLKSFFGLLGGGVALALTFLLHQQRMTALAPVLLAFPVIGFLGPNFMLGHLARHRRLEIRYALPDMLDLLIINIEAGIGLDGAIFRAVERLRMPLTDELNRVLSEVSAGKPRIQSLREMAERLRIEDLSLIIASMQQAETMGTGIAHALKGQAEQMRKRRSNELRELAAKLPTKLLFPIVLFIFPTLFMVLLGPGMIMILRSGAF